MFKISLLTLVVDVPALDDLGEERPHDRRELLGVGIGEDVQGRPVRCMTRAESWGFVVMPGGKATRWRVVSSTCVRGASSRYDAIAISKFFSLESGK